MAITRASAQAWAKKNWRNLVAIALVVGLVVYYQTQLASLKEIKDKELTTSAAEVQSLKKENSDLVSKLAAASNQKLECNGATSSEVEAAVAKMCVGKVRYLPSKAAPVIARSTPVPAAPSEQVTLPSRPWGFVQYDATEVSPKACYVTSPVKGHAPKCSSFEVVPPRAGESEAGWTARIAKDYVRMQGFETKHLGKM